MKYYDLESFEKELDILFPFQTAENWDNVGLQVASQNKTVSRVLLSLDLDNNVLQYARKNRFEVVLAHHPLIFKPLNKIIAYNDSQSSMIRELILANISFIALHTNLDKFYYPLLAQKLGLKNIRPLSEDNIGSYGQLPAPMKLGAFLELVKKKLGLARLTYAGDDEKMIRQAACVGGGGSAYFNTLLHKKKIDAFVTADVKYHTALYASEINIPIIDANHFATENIMLAELQKVLKKRFKDSINFELSPFNTNPLKFY